jgi:hypothetical protein
LTDFLDTLGGMDNVDAFTGVWVFNAQRSTLSTPPPLSWVQRIKATAHSLDVEEEISSQDGSTSVVTIHAMFDGEDYPVAGSPIADAFSYRRDGGRIAGTGKKNGAVSIRETVVAADDERVMTLSYSIFVGMKEVGSGVAVFKQDAS